MFGINKQLRGDSTGSFIQDLQLSTRSFHEINDENSVNSFGVLLRVAFACREADEA